MVDSISREELQEAVANGTVAVVETLRTEDGLPLERAEVAAR